MTTEITITVPPLPAPLDSTVYHTRAQYRAWQAAHAAHYDGLRAVERQEQERERRDNTVRHLSESEYDERGLAAFNAQRQKELEQAAENLRKQREREEWMASSPDVVHIVENNPHSFLTTLAHFLAKDCYAMDFDALWHMSHTFCSIQLNKKQANSKKNTVQ